MSTDTSTACANIEFAHRAHAVWNRGEREAWLDMWEHGGEWDLSHFEQWLEQPCYRGRDELAEIWDLWFGLWDEFHVDLPEIQAVGDDVVVSVQHQRGRGRDSGAVVEMVSAGINYMRDGKAARYETWSDIEAARRAAGAEGGGLPLVKAMWSVNPADFTEALADDAFPASVRPLVEPMLTDDFEFALVDPDSLSGGTWQGFEGMIAGAREWTSEWEAYRVEPGRYIDTGSCVVLLLGEDARSRTAGIDIRSKFGVVHFMEDGKLRRVEAHRSHARALRAAGLSKELGSGA